MIYIKRKEITMDRLSVIDIVSIQECLEAYKVLLTWLPAPTVEEKELKRNRFDIIHHLQLACENDLAARREDA